MNVNDVLKYGHLTVLQTIEGLPEPAWYTPGVCGVWSVKDIMAHLTSFEHLLVDALNSLLGGRHTPALDKFHSDAEQFNQTEVMKRHHHSVAAVLAEYQEVYDQAAKLLAELPDEIRCTNGLLTWYGPDYDLEDFITYAFYGHKREHCAQIAVYRDVLAGKGEDR